MKRISSRTNLIIEINQINQINQMEIAITRKVSRNVTINWENDDMVTKVTELYINYGV